MAKDPAFLFYSSDFLTGTMFMSNEQVGKYIRLLCANHQKGSLTEDEILTVCGVRDESIFSKFKKQKDGTFCNPRLITEIKKRSQHSKKQRDNALKRWHTDGNATASIRHPSGIPPAMPLENENAIVFREYVEYINTKTSKKYKGCAKSKAQFRARLNEGYTLQNFKQAIDNATADKYHKEQLYRYLTPEFFTRADKLDKFMNASEGGPQNIENHPSYNYALQRKLESCRRLNIPFENDLTEYVKATGQ